MKYKAKDIVVEWVSKGSQDKYGGTGLVFGDQGGSKTHWSRWFEYPWVIEHGLFMQNHKVLDAAGGTNSLQKLLIEHGLHVTNLDSDASHSANGTEFVHADIRKIPLADASFDRVLCVSAIEHVERPEEALSELWRVLKPGGFLLLTADVSCHIRWNQQVDRKKMIEILGWFCTPIPAITSDCLVSYVSHDAVKEGDEPSELEYPYTLKCLCFKCEKIE